MIKNSYVHPRGFLPLTTVGCDLCDLLPEYRLVSCWHINSSSLEICLQRVVEAHPWATTASRTTNWDKHERFITNSVLVPQPSPLQFLSHQSRNGRSTPSLSSASLYEDDNRSAGEEHALLVWWSSHRGNVDLSHWTRRAPGHRAMKQTPQNDEVSLQFAVYCSPFEHASVQAFDDFFRTANSVLLPPVFPSFAMWLPRYTTEDFQLSTLSPTVTTCKVFLFNRLWPVKAYQFALCRW